MNHICVKFSSQAKQSLSDDQKKQLTKIKNNKYQKDHSLKLKHQKDFFIFFLRSNGYLVELENENENCKHIFRICNDKEELINKPHVQKLIQLLKSSNDEIDSKIVKLFKNEASMIDYYFQNFMIDLLESLGYNITTKKRDLRSWNKYQIIEMEQRGNAFREETIQTIRNENGYLIYDGTTAVYQVGEYLYCQGIPLEGMYIENNGYWCYENDYFLVENEIPNFVNEYPMVNNKKIRYDFGERVFKTFSKETNRSFSN